MLRALFVVGAEDLKAAKNGLAEEMREGDLRATNPVKSIFYAKRQIWV
jgi:hypothetical protein